MAGIAEQIRIVRASIPAHVTLVCVSKFQPIEAIREAYDAGERHFGESRVQELQRKVPVLPDDIRWHFIGHLQTNKVRDLLKLRPYLIQSVDSIKLLRAINEEAARLGIVQDILLEVHVAKEESKTGFTPEEIADCRLQISDFLNVRVCGLMTMATNTEDETEIRRCFTAAHALLGDLPIFSAGMSDDYRLAIACGSTMVRIGSSIFGERDYTGFSPKRMKAVFFDQDGVLFNSMPFHAQSWELAMASYGLPFNAADAYRHEGQTGAAAIREVLTKMGQEERCTDELIKSIYQTKSDHFNRLTGGVPPAPIDGIRDVLAWLRAHDIQCWVVTGSGQRTLVERLQSTFNDAFTGIITAYDVTHGKPDPEPYLKAWERSGFKKEECCVVENAPLGVRAGKAAGIFTIAVNTGPLPDSDLAKEGADLVLHDMSALLAFFSR